MPCFADIKTCVQDYSMSLALAFKILTKMLINMLSGLLRVSTFYFSIFNTFNSRTNSKAKDILFLAPVEIGVTLHVL